MAFTNNTSLNHLKTGPNGGQMPYNMHLAGIMPYGNFPHNFALPATSPSLSSMNTAYPVRMSVANDISPLNLDVKTNLPVNESHGNKYNQAVTVPSKMPTPGLSANTISQTKDTCISFKEVQNNIVERPYNSMENKSNENMLQNQYSDNINNIPYAPAPTGFLENILHKGCTKKEEKGEQTREVTQLTERKAELNDDHQHRNSSRQTNIDSNHTIVKHSNLVEERELKSESVNDKPSCSFTPSCSNVLPRQETCFPETKQQAVPMSSQSNKNVDRVHVCTFCNKAFKRKDHLNRHKNKFHIDKPSTDSNPCSITTESNSQSNTNINPPINYPSIDCKDYTLNPQVQELLNKEFPYECSDCRKVFTRKDHVQRHKVTHSNVKPYECDLCLKIFSRKDHLKRHRNGHTKEISYDCDHCDKIFTRKDHLDRHLQKHHTAQCKKALTVNSG